jgi:hypothetical protein
MKTQKHTRYRPARPDRRVIAASKPGYIVQYISRRSRISYAAPPAAAAPKQAKHTHQHPRNENGKNMKKKINLESAKNDTDGIATQQMKRYGISLPTKSPPVLPVFPPAGCAAGRR